LLPYIAIHGSIQKQKQSYAYSQPISFLRTQVSNRATSYGIQLVQPLFDVAKWASYQQGQQALASAESQFQLKQQQTMLQTAGAWLDVLRAKAAFQAAQANEHAMLRVRQQAEASFHLGATSINDSLLATSRFDLATAQRLHAQNQWLQAQAQLSSLLGSDADVQVRIPHTMVPLALQPNTLKAWQQQAEEHALGIHLASQRKTLAEQKYLESVGNALPKVQLVAGWNRTKNTDGTFGGSDVKTSSIGIELNAPIFAGGALSARRRQATQEKVQAEYLVAEVQRSTRLATQQAWLGIQSSQSELKALKHAKQSAQQALKASHIGFEVGLKSLNDVLDAQQRLASTQQAYADALARYVMSWLQLHATAGILKPQDLKVVDQLFSAQ